MGINMSKQTKYVPEKRLIQLEITEEIKHGICVSNLALWISKELHLSDELCHQMAIAGVLHDIGKIKLSNYIYGEKESLHIEELKYIRMHPALGSEIIREQEYPEIVAKSVLHHHENYDGSGYPDNLSGEDIPLGSRILRICDVYAALTSDRPYRKSFDKDIALELMIEEIKSFDIKIFIAFQRIVHDDSNIQKLEKINELVRRKIDEYNDYPVSQRC